MEWYYHVLVYPQAFFGILPSYVWKTVVGLRDFLIDVKNTKDDIMQKMIEEESYESDSEESTASTTAKKDT